MDEYQNRRDIDKIYDDLYDQISGSLNVLTFMEDSPYKNIASKDDGSDRGTIDAIIDYYDLTNKGGGGGGDLSNYYTKTEINGILSSYVTNQTLEDYALKSELFSGSYNDLTDVPSSFPPSTHTHNWDSVTGKPSTFPPSSHNHDDRYYTESEVDTALNGKQDTLISGTNIKTLNNESLLGSGNIDSPQNVFYGTCSTSASTQTKVVTVDDWSFTTGNIIFVYFQNGNSYNGTAKLSIDNTVKNITSVGSNETSQYYWKSGEMVGFVYDGTNMVLLEGGTATTTYYGITKLSDSISSTSTSLSATANAVRKAYNLADGKADSVHTHTVSDVTDFPSIPSKTSDLTNDGDDGSNPFVSDDDSRLSDARTPTAHTHDDRYYTESEVDTLLGSKAPSSHTHDESEITLEANHYNINTSPFPPDVYAETQDELNNYLYDKANIDVPHTVAEIFTHIDTYYDYYQ